MRLYGVDLGGIWEDRTVTASAVGLVSLLDRVGCRAEVDAYILQAGEQQNRGPVYAVMDYVDRYRGRMAGDEFTGVLALLMDVIGMEGVHVCGEQVHVCDDKRSGLRLLIGIPCETPAFVSSEHVSIIKRHLQTVFLNVYFVFKRYGEAEKTLIEQAGTEKLCPKQTDRVVHICASEVLEGLNLETTSLTLRISDENLDVVRVVKAACNEYVQTAEGKKLLELNCGCFNWGDLPEVPNEICKKHGFEILESYQNGLNVNLTDQLVGAE